MGSLDGPHLGDVGGTGGGGEVSKCRGGGGLWMGGGEGAKEGRRRTRS